MGSLRPGTRVVAVVAAALVLSGCLHADVRHLSTDEMGGRVTNTPGGVAARDFIVRTLARFTEGAISGESGPAAYQQSFGQGVNVLGVIEGTTRPHEYVMIGAHYDHIDHCGTIDGDSTCNGATDNATGVAMVLEMARRFAAEPPDRSVVFAFWDAEEIGLLGSTHYVNHPVVPLAQTVAYLNLDIQGANLLPTLQNTTFAVGANSGGPVLADVVAAAYGDGVLDGVQLSAVFGLYRSDYAPFLGKSVPTVFFTDSTGPCYHSPKDDVDVVDFAKLDRQTEVLHRTAAALAYRPDSVSAPFPTPTWTVQPTATYHDTVHLLAVIEATMPDWNRYPPALRADALALRDVLAAIVDAGPDEFGDDDLAPLLIAANTAVNLLTYGDCDGFLP